MTEKTLGDQLEAWKKRMAEKRKQEEEEAAKEAAKKVQQFPTRPGMRKG
jgi:hypothetical protein